MGNYSWEDLDSFVMKEACISPKKVITLESTFDDDLGQQGDDADLFMQHFFEVFRANSGDYDFQHYFLMEGEGGFYHWLMKLLRKPHTLKRETLTGHASSSTR